MERAHVEFDYVTLSPLQADREVIAEAEHYTRVAAYEDRPASVIRRFGSNVLGFILEGAPHVGASFGFMLPTYLESQRTKKSD